MEKPLSVQLKELDVDMRTIGELLLWARDRIDQLEEALQQIVDLSYKEFPKASLEVIEMTTIARRALEAAKDPS